MYKLVSVLNESVIVRLSARWLAAVWRERPAHCASACDWIRNAEYINKPKKRRMAISEQCDVVASLHAMLVSFAALGIV